MIKHQKGFTIFGYSPVSDNIYEYLFGQFFILILQIELSNLIVYEQQIVSVDKKIFGFPGLEIFNETFLEFTKFAEPSTPFFSDL